jgi:hypothetical protein
LVVEVGLSTVISTGLIVKTTMKLDDCKVLPGSIRGVCGFKLLQVRVSGILFQERCVTDSAATLWVALVVNIVKLKKAGWSNGSIASGVDLGRSRRCPFQGRHGLSIFDDFNSRLQLLDASKSCCRLDKVYVRSNLIRNRVLEGSKNRSLLIGIAEPLELGA